MDLKVVDLAVVDLAVVDLAVVDLAKDPSARTFPEIRSVADPMIPDGNAQSVPTSSWSSGFVNFPNGCKRWDL